MFYWEARNQHKVPGWGVLLPRVGITRWLCSPAAGRFLCGPASLSLGWRPQKHPAHRAALRMQERSPAALATGAGPEWAPNRCPLVPCCVLAPRLPRGLCRHYWLLLGKSPHLVLAIQLFFSICPKEALVGTQKQEEEKGASCPLSPASRGWSWPGKHRNGGSRVHRSMVVGDVFFVRWSKFLLYWGKSAQWVAGRVCAGHPQSLHPLPLHC